MSARADQGSRREPVAEQLAEIAALEATRRDRPLTREEDARLDLLVQRDLLRARYRPQRIVHLQRELALLLEQERAAEQRVLAKQPRLPLIYVVRAA